MPPPAEGIASRFVLGPALRAQPDRRLVTLVREGYESAFEEIVRRYGRPLTRYAAAIVGGRSEDVTQDAFSKALQALRRDDAEIELRPWLFRIVRNTALNDLRDSPPAAEELAEAIAGGRSAAEEAERREELTDLIERLQALPEPQRAAIVMRELEGLSHEEIAAALGVTGGAARQAIHRARRALRNGAGMLIPLPLLKALLAGAGPGAAEAATGAAGIGSAAGAGVALKATAATVLVVGAVGAGVALDEHPRHSDAKAVPARDSTSDPGRAAGAAAGAGAAADLSSSGEDRHGRGNDDDDQRRHHGNEANDDHGGHGNENGDDHRGHGRGSDQEGGSAQLEDDHGGGGGSGHSGGDDLTGSSGHGDGGSGGQGGSGSGHSGGNSGASGHGDGGSSGDGGSGSGKGSPGAGDGSGSSGSSSGGGSGSDGGPKPEETSSGELDPSGVSAGSDDSGSGESGSSGGHSGHG